MKNEIRHTNIDDIHYISLHLRNADKEEIYASTGNRLYLHTLLESYELSKVCYTWLIDDKPTFVFGVVDGGIVWAMGTDLMLKQKLYFVENATKYIDEFLQMYDLVYNYVYTKNTVHIKWLRRVGFIFDEEPVTLKNGEKFIRFWRKKDV